MMRRALVVGAMVALTGCGDKADLCSQAVRHMIDPSMGPAGSKPGKEEQQIIDVVVKVTDQRHRDDARRQACWCVPERPTPATLSRHQIKLACA